MSTVGLYGHGVYCYLCQEVYETTDGCEHDLADKDGVQKGRDGYYAQPEDAGHTSPCFFMEIDGFEECGECGRVLLPDEVVEDE